VRVIFLRFAFDILPTDLFVKKFMKLFHIFLLDAFILAEKCFRHVFCRANHMIQLSGIACFNFDPYDVQPIVAADRIE